MAKLLTLTNLLLSCLLCFSLGCSAEQDSTLGTVSGRVTLNGEGFSNCKVSVYNPKSFKSRSSKPNPDGTYNITKVEPGDQIVAVFPPPLEDDAEVARIPIPKKLQSRDTTDLSVTVTANENTELDIELKR